MTIEPKKTHDPVERVLGEVYEPYFAPFLQKDSSLNVTNIKPYHPNQEYDFTPAAGK